MKDEFLNRMSDEAGATLIERVEVLQSEAMMVSDLARIATFLELNESDPALRGCALALLHEKADALAHQLDRLGMDMCG